jgi:hypothetical protein
VLDKLGPGPDQEIATGIEVNAFTKALDGKQPHSASISRVAMTSEEYWSYPREFLCHHLIFEFRNLARA